MEKERASIFHPLDPSAEAKKVVSLLLLMGITCSEMQRRGNSMANFRKFVAALALGLILSLALLTSSFAHTTNQSTATQKAVAANTSIQAIAQTATQHAWGGYGYGFGWGGGWGGCCSCGWDGGW